MQVAGVLQDFGFAASNYKFSNDTAAMEKDGMQALALGFISSIRASLLCAQVDRYFPMTTTAPKIAANAITFAPAIMGMLATVAAPLAQNYVDKNPKPDTLPKKALVTVCKGVVQLGKGCSFLLQHSDKVLNVACCVASVALIIFGFPISGAIGLFGLFLLALKRYQLIPAMIERIIDPIIILGTLVTSILTPSFIVFRVLSVAICTIQLANEVLNNKFARYLMPESVKNPLHGKHIIHERSNEQKDVLKRVEHDEMWGRFSVNSTYVYADEVGQLLPVDYDKELDNIDTKVLFDDFEAKIKARDITLGDLERVGLDDMKLCALTGRANDKMPSDVELFQKVIKALVHSIMKDDLNFDVKVKELADIGQSCQTGWTRDVTNMLAPQSKRVQWAVHNVLSKMRGGIVKEAIQEADQKVRQFSAVNLDMAGGNNNIHISDALQVAFWHRLRTFEGELHMQLNPLSPLSSLFVRHAILGDNKAPIGFVERAYMGMMMQLVHIGLAGCAILIPLMENDINNKVNDPARLVDAIYEGIKPEIVMASDNKADPRRAIDWEGVLSWFGEITERRKIDMEDPKWIQQDDYGNTYLTKAGVKLLLWDMGILKVA